MYGTGFGLIIAERGIFFEQQPKYEATYKGHFLGHLIPDLVIERTLIVDAKCVDAFGSVHDAQMIGYLNITGLDVALLLNFKTWPLGKKRILRPGFQFNPSQPPQ